MTVSDTTVLLERRGAIEQFPGVISAAVIGLPDPDLGAKAHAIVELASGHPAHEPTALAAFLATRRKELGPW